MFEARTASAGLGMRVLVTSAYRDPEPIATFRALMERDRFGVHRATNDPDDADIILFVENSHYHDDVNFSVLRQHPWVRQYREKTFMYNEHDRPWCVLPGLYFSMPRRSLDPSRQRACGFIRELNPLVTYAAPEAAEPDLLFSFAGSWYPNVRSSVLLLQHPRGHLENTDGYKAYQITDDPEKRIEAQRRYAEVMTRSKFILCPRGVATSSPPVFEAMKAGRVPVIISDQYALPRGPEWNEFSVRVPERRVKDIPGLLEERENEWARMGAAARRAWETWFAPDVLFHRMVDDCRDILVSRRLPETVMQRLPQLKYINWRTRTLLQPLERAVRGR